MANKGEKMYIVRKMVFAKNASEALKKAKKIQATEAYIHPDWEKANVEKADAIGFLTVPQTNEDEY